jgi:SAM-dependent methyltransferase
MSLLRNAECKSLSSVSLSGGVVDLGGEKRSDYRKVFKGTFTLTTVNLLKEAEPDVVADLEQPLPFADASYDAALLLNVLEHIFNYKILLREARRILKPRGAVVIVVPFMFPNHPSPHDYHRFTKEALERELAEAGFITVNMAVLGSGVFAVRYSSLERLLPGMLQRGLAPVAYPLVRMSDFVFARIAQLLRKKYAPDDYALGFSVVAHTPA